MRIWIQHLSAGRYIVHEQQERETSAGKGSTANFVWKCSSCKRESSAKFEPKSPVKSYSADANGQLAPIVTLDCRGLEFIGFDPRVNTWNSPWSPSCNIDRFSQGIWKCVGIDSGTVFPEVDLEDGDWVDYDEKVRHTRFPHRALLNAEQAALPVGVSNIESQWNRA